MIIKPSPTEKVQAILDARKDVFEFLQSIGKVHVFDDFTKDDIAGLIRAAQEGVQNSLQRQAASGFGAGGNAIDDEIPFAPEVRA
jgi:hypothetical protein